MGPTPPEATSGAPEQRSSPPLAGLTRGLRPPLILAQFPGVGGGARRCDVNPRFPRAEPGPGTPLVPHRGQQVPTDSAEEAYIRLDIDNKARGRVTRVTTSPSRLQGGTGGRGGRESLFPPFK